MTLSYVQDVGKSEPFCKDITVGHDEDLFLATLPLFSSHSGAKFVISAKNI